MSYNPPYQQPYLPPGTQMLPPKGPREYSIFGTMLRSPFFSAKVSRDVARNRGGINFWYLFLLELITWIIVLIKIQMMFSHFVQNDFPKRIANFPSITLASGHVSSTVKQPCILNDNNGKPVMALDTTGKLKSMADTTAVMLLTDHMFYVRQQDGSIKSWDLSGSKVNLTVDKTVLQRWMDSIRQWGLIASLPFIVIVSMIGRLLLALIYGLINLMLASMFSVNLPFAAAMRLAVVSFTPVILLNTVLDLTGIQIRLWILIAFFIDLMYMVMAVRANAVPTVPPQGFPVGMPDYAPQSPGA